MSAPATADKPAPPRDHVRETAETLVFVVVLVLILQLFVLEAFVIPTGSMAETQFGYHKDVTCAKCQFEFPVNASDEADGLDVVSSYTCPNCQYHHETQRVPGTDKKIPLPFPLATGDRVLVHKMMTADDRGRVMVFKYPKAPQKKQQAQNYIKRCMGFGGETVALAYGDLYTTRALTYPENERPDDPRDLWQHRYTYPRDKLARARFDADKKDGFPAGRGGFELYRKPDDLALEMRRIVNNNDFQPSDQPGGVARWAVREGAGWTADSATAPKAFAHAGDGFGWIGYRHLARARQGSTKPALITDTLGYNCNRESDPDDDNRTALWVGDLMLECTAEVDADSVLVLQLSKGAHRYTATFAGGKVELLRTGPGNLPAGWPVSRPTPMTAGTYRLRFANVDCRLRVWVNDKAIDFGTDADYAPTADGFKPTDANDRDGPAGVGAKGRVAVSRLSIWRDSYYTPMSAGGLDLKPDETNRDVVETYYVHPGHYLCLGDNSAQSSDGRNWGLVPERLMIGRAVFTFWPGYPSWRIGVIR